MPAVYALGRRWHLSSDDLVVPGAFGSIFFATWTGLLAAAEGKIEEGSFCPTSAFTRYVSALLAFSAVSCVLHALLAWQSNLGSMLDEAKRRWVPWLLYFIAVIYGGMLGLIIWGSVLMADSQHTTGSSGCSSSGQWTAISRTIVYGSWAAIGMVFLAVLFIFNTFPSHSSPSAWVWRCTCLLCMCCSLDGTSTMSNGLQPKRDKQGMSTKAADCEEGGECPSSPIAGARLGGLSPHEQLGLTCHALFSHETLTVSDYVFGLVLLGTKHRLRREANIGPGPVNVGEEGGIAASLLMGELPDVSAPAPPSPLAQVQQTKANGAVHPVHGLDDDHGCRKEQVQGAQRGQSDRQGHSPGSAAQAAQPEPLVLSPPHANHAALGLAMSAEGDRSALTVAADGCGREEGCGVLPQAQQQQQQQHLQQQSEGLQEPQAQQQQQQQQRAEATAFHCDLQGSQEHEVPAWVLEAAARYKMHALGTFGWPMYTFVHRGSISKGLCSLLCGRGCHSCRLAHAASRTLPRMLCGGWWKCMGLRRRLNLEAVTRFTGLHDEDVVMICDSNQVAGLLPYTVAVDHKHQEVILAIRGSFSMADVLTDTFWQPVDMTEVLRSSGMCLPPPSPVHMSRASEHSNIEEALACHEGILMCSIAIKNHLEQYQVLHAAFEKGRKEGQQQQGSTSDYKLIITGHSLGAGVAAVLGLLLLPSYPGLRVWAHAPPGGTLSPKAAKMTTEFCTSIVHAKDMVPRLTTSNLQLMLKDMMMVGALCKRSKTEVLLRSMLGKRWTEDELFHASWDDVPPGVKGMLHDYQKALEDSQDNLPPEWELSGKFVPPGQIVFLEDFRGPKPDATLKQAVQPSCKGQAAGSTSVPLFQAANGSSTDPPIPAAAAAAATTTTAIASTAADGPTGSSRRWAAQGAPSMSQAMSRQQYMRQYQRRYAVRFVPAHTIVEGGLMVALSMFEDHMPDKQLKSLKSCKPGTS
uniref:sn-1-specific diacylglycerol lipase n=1 Tax=Dunaliella tertiolecta TaxID=3047 RepID=A0A7S3VM95_DUNTE